MQQLHPGLLLHARRCIKIVNMKMYFLYEERRPDCTCSSVTACMPLQCWSTRTVPDDNSALQAEGMYQQYQGAGKWIAENKSCCGPLERGSLRKNTKRGEADVQRGQASQRLCNRAITEFVKPRYRAACSMHFACACACEWPQPALRGAECFLKAVLYRQGELRGKLRACRVSCALHI